MSEADSLCNKISEAREPGKQGHLRSGRKEGEKNKQTELEQNKNKAMETQERIYLLLRFLESRKVSRRR